VTGWDDLGVASRYLAFECHHARYRLANRALVRHACLTPGLRVLDFAAGTGGTTAAMLAALGAQGSVDAIEPAAAMRRLGQRRLSADERVSWQADLAESRGTYERIVCGAAIWQVDDLPALLGRLAALLRPGGALVFNIPAAYLGRADRPGGGRDAWLTELSRRLAADALPATPPWSRAALPRPRALTRELRSLGLQVQRWHHDQRVTQAALRDWLKIPILTEGIWPGVDADERERRIDSAYAEVDGASWRHERWLGWTAWRPTFAVNPILDCSGSTSDALHERARRDGHLLLRRCVPRQDVQRLAGRVRDAAAIHGLLDYSGRWRGGRAAATHELPPWLELQARVAAMPEFQSMARHPALLAAMRSVFGAEPLPDQGSVCRVAAPEHVIPSTATHRDADYVDDRIWIAWLPLTATPLQRGVLALEGADGHWSASPLAPGDALLFAATTAHRACANFSFSQARLSVDFRFRPAKS
jgi:trans-aconitate methyltransferase